MHSFRAPDENLGTLDGSTAAELLGAAADIAMVVDNRGVIRDMSFGSEELASRDLRQWIGSRWIDTVAPDSHDKVRKILGSGLDPELGSGSDPEAPRHRQINHRLADGSNLMILYRIVDLDQRGYRVAVGKDLSSLERMQQKLVNVQQMMERDYTRLRQFETRYRVLFQTAPDAILIAATDGLQIVEANPAACALLDVDERKLLRKKLLQCFKEPGRIQLEGALRTLEQGRQPVTIEIEVGDSTNLLSVSLSTFKTNSVSHVLLRVKPPVVDETALVAPSDDRTQAERLKALIDNMPDALVVTDKRGIILSANAEFVDIAQVSSAELAFGQPLSRWLGSGGIDLQVIMNSLKENGSIRLYSSRLRGEYGSPVEVEVSAAAIETADGTCFGFSLRDIGRRTMAANDASSAAVLPRSNDQLTGLVGRVPLKELVRESTELIEQLCIEAALRMTGNNRASAAEMLGLSRQSLYVKLRRYAMDEDLRGEDSNKA